MIHQDKDFGSTLSELRKESHLSQEGLAEKLNVTRQTVSSWERNKSVPDLSTLRRLCVIFGIRVDELVRGGIELKEGDHYQPNKYDQAIGLGYAVALFIAPIIFSMIFIFFRNHFDDLASILFLIASCLCAFLAIGLSIHMGITLRRK